MPPPTYPGRNSNKDVARRIWNVEDQSIPTLQNEIDNVEQQLNEEIDAPDFTVIIANALL